VANRLIVEKNNFLVDFNLSLNKEHSFYVIDSDGYYYKNNFKGKISSRGFNFNEGNVLIGCNWDPV